MKKRYFAHYALKSGAWFVLLSGIAAGLGFLAMIGKFGTEWQLFVLDWSNALHQFIDERRDFLKSTFAGLGAVFTIGSGLLALAKSYHYSEENLPQRLEGMIQAHLTTHIRGPVLAMAGAAGDDANFLRGSTRKSVFDWLFAFFSGPSSQAKVVAISLDDYEGRVRVLERATAEAKTLLATSHLVRGTYRKARKEHDEAFLEFDAAANAKADDLEALNKAAASARRLQKSERELQLLEALEAATARKGEKLLQAVALRRQAEVLINTAEPAKWQQARDALWDASEILGLLAATNPVKLEIGRRACLFCQVQAKRNRIGMLASPLRVASEHLAGVAMDWAPDEEGGEKYGAQRVEEVRLQIAEREIATDGD